jgi:RHS repeat-associated protein
MAMTAQLGENSHPGFEGIKAALCLAEMDANSNLTSGMQPCVRRNGTGSRCSGKERDAESNLDYFGARYFSGAQGRFTSVDPGRADSTNPQSWNRYVYAINNPLKYIDPDGKEVRVFTERLGSATAKAAAIFRPRHTFIHVTTDSVDVVIELGGPTDKTKPKGNPILTKISSGFDISSGRLSVLEEPVMRPEGVGPDNFKFENDILKNFDILKKNLPDYNPAGPNSNGFAAFLIQISGGKVKLPFNAVGSDETDKYAEAYLQDLWRKMIKKQEEQKKKEEKDREKENK